MTVRGRQCTNLLRLSKNAVSYSSASMTKYFEVPSRAEMPKFCGTPPTRKPGASPACSSNQASSAEVVVLRSEEHTSETPVTNAHLVCRLLLEKKNMRLILYQTKVYK